jgi:hypothetical protein
MIDWTLICWAADSDRGTSSERLDTFVSDVFLGDDADDVSGTPTDLVFAGDRCGGTTAGQALRFIEHEIAFEGQCDQCEMTIRSPRNLRSTSMSE